MACSGQPDQGLCGASKVVKTATDGPCGVEECAASGAMATHGTMQTHDVTLYISYHSNRMWRHQHYCLRCWRTVSMNHNADACATMQQGAYRAHDRPLAATQTPIATNPGGTYHTIPYITVHAVTSCNYTVMSRYACR